jgi:hypothetical protein
MNVIFTGRRAITGGGDAYVNVASGTLLLLTVRACVSVHGWAGQHGGALALSCYAPMETVVVELADTVYMNNHAEQNGGQPFQSAVGSVFLSQRVHLRGSGVTST